MALHSDDAEAPRKVERRKTDQDRTEAIDQLVAAVERNTRSVKALRDELGRRPTRRTVERQRRRTIVLVIFIVLGTSLSLDQHNQLCGPGARASRTVAQFANLKAGDPTNLQKLQATFVRQASPWCDVVSPFHSHDEDPWPTGPDVGGIAFYAALVGGLILWRRGPRADEDEDFHQKPHPIDTPPLPLKENL